MSSPCVVSLLPSLAIHEGSVVFLYLDSAGNPTTGIGHLVSTMSDSLKLPWQPDDSATIISDFRAISSRPANRVPVFYEEATVCRLPMGWPEQDAAQRLETEFLPPLRALFPGAFDGFKMSAQVALLDMIYNLGLGRARTATHPATGLCEYVTMLGACSHGDWMTAAAQCGRRGISAQRNSWTVAQFQAAAQS